MSWTKIATALSGQVIGSINDAFVIAEWRDPGGPPGPPRLIAPPHLHRSDDEAWYVLEGTRHARVGKEVVEASAGAAVFVPRGTPHTYWNPGPDAVRYLLVMTANIYHFDSGNPRPERADSGYASRGVCKIRLRTARRVVERQAPGSSTSPLAY